MCSAPSPPISGGVFVVGFHTGLLTCPVSELSQQSPNPICDLFTALCLSSLAGAAGGAVLIGAAFARLRYLITVVRTANIPKTCGLLAVPIACPCASRRVTFCISRRLQMGEKRLSCGRSRSLGEGRG